jgi:hypothetical protein
MHEQEHPLGRHLDVFSAVIEGRLEPAEWLAWWDRHVEEVKAAISPGMFLRLKPAPSVLRDPAGPVTAAARGQLLARHVLDQLGVACEQSTRYTDERTAIDERVRRELDAAAKARAAAYLPTVKSLAGPFPRFARYLRSHLDEIDECEPGVDDVGLVALERELGLRLPAGYRQFLRCARAVEVSSTLKMTTMHPFVVDPTAPAAVGLLCIADYWLESDGDQAMLDLRDDPGGDPPVRYYNHGDGSVRVIATSFTAWVEALPRALAG